MSSRKSGIFKPQASPPIPFTMAPFVFAAAASIPGLLMGGKADP